MAKYTVVGGVPFRDHTGTGTFLGLICLGVTEDPAEISKIIDEKYDECRGLLAVFDEDGKYPEDLPETCNFTRVYPKDADNKVSEDEEISLTQSLDNVLPTLARIRGLGNLVCIIVKVSVRKVRGTTSLVAIYVNNQYK